MDSSSAPVPFMDRSAGSDGLADFFLAAAVEYNAPAVVFIAAADESNSRAEGSVTPANQASSGPVLFIISRDEGNSRGVAVHSAPRASGR